MDNNTKRYVARFIVDIGNDYDEVHSLFKYTSVNITYWHGIVPPNKAEYEIGPITEIGIANWKEHLDKIGCKYRLMIADWDTFQAAKTST